MKANKESSPILKNSQQARSEKEHKIDDLIVNTLKIIDTMDQVLDIKLYK